ncbi:MAG: MerR family transcriptional regulator [Lachnospiraceae bacterium]|nr:MerR family transcriptional regulator [Lachnospiraceae bacterium]
MMTVNEVSKLTGVSIRTLQYYDNIGLLRPTGHTESGYRLYDDTALEKMQQILLFRELEFPLKDIKSILSRSDFDRTKALEQQTKLLELKKEHIENLLQLCRDLKEKGVSTLDFKAFDSSKLEEYSKKAKEQWGTTAEYKEFEKKSKGRTKDDNDGIMADFMKIFEEFGAMKDTDPASAEAKAQVEKLQAYISEHFYQCSNDVLFGLGQMYAAGDEFTENIDKMGGAGTAQFTYQAIKAYCQK